MSGLQHAVMKWRVCLVEILNIRKEDNLVKSFRGFDLKQFKSAAQLFSSSNAVYFRAENLHQIWISQKFNSFKIFWLRMKTKQGFFSFRDREGGHRESFEKERKKMKIKVQPFRIQQNHMRIEESFYNNNNNNK